MPTSLATNLLEKKRLGRLVWRFRSETTGTGDLSSAISVDASRNQFWTNHDPEIVVRTSEVGLKGRYANPDLRVALRLVVESAVSVALSDTGEFKQ